MAASAARDTATTPIPPSSSLEGLRLDDRNADRANKNHAINKSEEDNAAKAELRGAEPSAKPPKSVAIATLQLLNVSSSHAPKELDAAADSSQLMSSSITAYIPPTNSKSWAVVCSSSPTQPKSPPSPATWVMAMTESSIGSGQGSSTCVDSPKKTPTLSGSPSILELNDFIHHSGSWFNIANNKTSCEEQGAKTDSTNQEQQIVPTEADFQPTLPSSPQQPPGSSSLSYVKVVQSPSSKAMAPDCASTETVTQSKLSPEVTVTPLASVVIEQRLDNLYAMIRPERQNLFSGPLITITIDSVKVTGIFKRVAMALSSVLNEYFVQNPESIEYQSPAENLVPGAAFYLLNIYPHETSQVFMVPPVPMQETFAMNVSLLHASRKLGMVRYTKEILSTHINYLKEEIPSYEEIAIIEEMKTSDQDPLWTHMVNHLCHDRFKGLIPDPEEFEAFLTHHTRLSEAMRTADEYFAGVAKKKWEVKQVQWQAAEEHRRMRWEQAQIEKRERIAKEKAAMEAIKQKMDAKSGSGLMMATAEEAALLRKRRGTLRVRGAHRALKERHSLVCLSFKEKR
jgi:hypothetical protein